MQTVKKLGAKALALTFVGAMVAACGGLGGGDHVTYRVASSRANYAGDCNTQFDAGDSTTFRTGGTFMIYIVTEGDNDVPYLDVGTSVLEGSETDDGYTFHAEEVDAEDFFDSTVTTTTVLDVNVTMDGDSLTGDSTIVTTTACSGDCVGFEPGTCTATNDFEGVVVEEGTVVPAG
ncbi:MAG: hypothetical protein U0271_21030 [Polyangiaceae bacterium]